MCVLAHSRHHYKSQITPSDNLCQVSPYQSDTHQYGHHGMLEAHHMNNHQIDSSITVT